MNTKKQKTFNKKEGNVIVFEDEQLYVINITELGTRPYVTMVEGGVIIVHKNKVHKFFKGFKWNNVFEELFKLTYGKIRR